MIATTPRRRGVAGFAIFTLVMLMVFIGLGVWQLQRRIEKHALIAALTERLAAAPSALPAPSEWSALTPAKDEEEEEQPTYRLPAPRVQFSE